MPPKSAPRGRGGTGGGRPPRGTPSTRGVGRGGISAGPLPQTAGHVTTIGVRRPDFGKAGRVIKVQVNCYPATLPKSTIHHYDAIDPSNLPARVNMDLIKVLQHAVAPQIFTPKGSYDGKKNIFTSHRLKLAGTDAEEFLVPLGQANGGAAPTKPPKVYKVKITHVASINPEVLERFIQGLQSHDNEAITAITACNVALRMEPNSNYPFNTRSFFVEGLERRDIGGGIELWRGLFQSLRPGIGGMHVNVDIATGMMYKRGSLLDLCMQVLDPPTTRGAAPSPNMFSPSFGMNDAHRIRVQRFIAGVGVTVITTGNRRRVVRGLTREGADKIKFEYEGKKITVAAYWAMKLYRPLKFPSVVCAEIGRDAVVPLEVCTVLPGQIIRKQIPPSRTSDVLAFATKKPKERFDLISRGVSQHLQYGQSDYVRSLGMGVDTQHGPMVVQARTLPPPRLHYSRNSREPSIQPQSGAWNMRDKKLFMPCAAITQWFVVSYENERAFPRPACEGVVHGLVQESANLGMNFVEKFPQIRYQNPHGDIGQQLDSIGREIFQKTRIAPQLIVVILPEGGDEIYTAVKHFGDITRGVATQCLQRKKCAGARAQYWANVLLKVNVKRGGINAIVDPNHICSLADPANPTIVMGADVAHPAPGADGRPSFTALVASVDRNATKYVAIDNVQPPREEIILDLQGMVEHGLSKYIGYRKMVEQQQQPQPKRLIFFRDGVSEGQFAHVLQRELPLIKAALAAKKIVGCKITLVVVGKRHHVRMNPVDDKDRDRSGNAPAGTVIDRDIGHPTEFDYYLLSQGGLLGTSRPSHYSVLYDENGFMADAMQGISYGLCHVYARATRSVSIPAPVYYADIVCGRAKTHYDPTAGGLSDSATQTSQTAAEQYERFRGNFKPLSAYAQENMYFS